MNPLTNVKNITKLNEIELSRGLTTKASWHNLYKESAWIFIGGLAYGITEGDIITVFSQFGEIVNINMVRDKKTGKTKGFCFLCYANQKSTVLAVDNFNGVKICGRTTRVDHVQNYKPPKEHEDDDDLTKMMQLEGCAPKPIKLESEDEVEIIPTKLKKPKKEKKKKKHKKRAKDSTSSDEVRKPIEKRHLPKKTDSIQETHNGDTRTKPSNDVVRSSHKRKHSDLEGLNTVAHKHHSKHRSLKESHHSNSVSDAELNSRKNSHKEHHSHRKRDNKSSVHREKHYSDFKHLKIKEEKMD